MTISVTVEQGTNRVSAVGIKQEVVVVNALFSNQEFQSAINTTATDVSPFAMRSDELETVLLVLNTFQSQLRRQPQNDANSLYFQTGNLSNLRHSLVETCWSALEGLLQDRYGSNALVPGDTIQTTFGNPFSGHAAFFLQRQLEALANDMDPQTMCQWVAGSFFSDMKHALFDVD